jgi:hypothetical protein
LEQPVKPKVKIQSLPAGPKINFLFIDVLLVYCAGIRGEGNNGLETTAVVRLGFHELYSERGFNDMLKQKGD